MTMMKVADGFMCMDMNRKRMPAGTEFKIVPRVNTRKGHKYGPREVIAATAEDWMKSGHAVPLNYGERSAPNPLSVDNRRSAELPPLPAPAETGPVIQVSASGVKMVNMDKPPIRVTTPASPWIFNPDDLSHQPVEALNAMIADRLDDQQRPQFSPYTSQEEAIRHLSQDFSAGTAQAHQAQ